MVRAKNRLKAVFLSRGLRADVSVYDVEKRPEWLRKVPSPYRELGEWLGRQLDQLEPLRDEAERWLLRESKSHPIIRKLATAPGMGPIRTAQVVAIVATPDRFRTRRQFWSYCVLGIVTRSSADWARDRNQKWVRTQVAQTRGLSRKRHSRLKAVFKGAATTVIAQLPDDPLQGDYERMLQSFLSAISGPKSKEQEAEDGYAIQPGMDETSWMLFLKPALVDPAFRQARPATAAKMEGLVAVAKARDWTGYLGSPRLATAAHGAAVANGVAAAAVGAVMKVLDGADPRMLERFATVMEKSATDVLLDAASLQAEAERTRRQEAWIEKHRHR